MTIAAEQLWSVYVQGPDDIIPAPDWNKAVAWEMRINQVAATLLARNPSRDDPTVEAVVVLWPYSRESHAEGPGEEYRWLLEDPTDV